MASALGASAPPSLLLAPPPSIKNFWRRHWQQGNKWGEAFDCVGPRTFRPKCPWWGKGPHSSLASSLCPCLCRAYFTKNRDSPLLDLLNFLTVHHTKLYVMWHCHCYKCPIYGWPDGFGNQVRTSFRTQSGIISLGWMPGPTQATSGKIPISACCFLATYLGSRHAPLLAAISSRCSSLTRIEMFTHNDSWSSLFNFQDSTGIQRENGFRWPVETDKD